MDQLTVTRDALERMIEERLGKSLADQRKFLEELATKGHTPPTAAMPPWMQSVRPGRALGAGERQKAGTLTARVLAGMTAGKLAGGRVDAALKWTEKAWGTGDDMSPVQKALAQAQDFSTGGVWLEDRISTDFIEFLTNATTVRKIGASTEPMPEGTTKIRRQISATTAKYRGEGQATRADAAPTYEWVTLVAKELISKVPVSNRLIRYSADAVEARIQRDMQTQMSIREDLAFLRGQGDQHTPKGLRYWVDPANVFNANATFNHANSAKDLGKMEYLLEAANITAVKPVWIMSPRTANALKYLLTADGNWAFQAEMNAGQLLGAPFFTTNQIPNNLGGGTNESEIYRVDADAVVIADTGRVNVAVTTEGAYLDENGVVQSAFDNDETVVRITTEHDLGVRYEKGLAVMTAVTWAN